jgi:hypothetical protein
VAAIKLLPKGFKPLGLTNLAIWICPNTCWPPPATNSTETVPSRPTVKEEALLGMVILGSSKKPVDVTNCPVPVSLKVTITRVGNRAVLLLYLKKSVTHDGNIQGVLAVDQVTLDMELFSRNHFGTCTQHQACRVTVYWPWFDHPLGECFGKASLQTPRGRA